MRVYSMGDAMKRCRLLLALGLATLIAACAPISTEKVAATARPTGKTADSEHFWDNKVRQDFAQAIETATAGCTAADNGVCARAKLVAAWPSASAFANFCSGATAVAVASCLVEYDYWAKMGQKFYPSYRIRDAWASFDLPNNPTYVEWFTKVNGTCDPNLNKSQDAFYSCVTATAKRDLSIAQDATNGCFYTGLPLSNFCYWMAAFNAYALDRLKALPGA